MEIEQVARALCLIDGINPDGGSSQYMKVGRRSGGSGKLASHGEMVHGLSSNWQAMVWKAKKFLALTAHPHPVAEYPEPPYEV